MNPAKRTRLNRREFRRIMVSIHDAALMAAARQTLCIAALALVLPLPCLAQTPPAIPAQSQAEAAKILKDSTAEQMREMKLLGIKELQPTASTRDPKAPDFANYDEAKANPYPNIPDVLTTKDGVKVTTADQWWKIRRPELLAIFDREIYGFTPKNLPKVSWTVKEVVHETIGGVPAITKKLVGHVDNSRDPKIVVEILMNVTTPAGWQGRKVPVIMSFGAVNPRPYPATAFHIVQPNIPDYRQQILERNWGFATLDTNSVQADNAAGLTKGIIGLVNKGKPRSLSDWGVLKAWAWGAGRGLDYLETDPDVNAKAVGIMGHSRGGKAALVTMVYDQRFAIGYLSSSGLGGANLYRRNYGEGIANLEANIEFHWFAGNFMKYDAVGRTADELPVDAHEMLAMVAPRPVFIGGGALIMSPSDAIPGDAWVDSKGMFMSAAAASPVWELLGAKGLETATFPPMLTLLDRGDVAYRQHEYGHTPTPNWSYFLGFAARYLQLPPAL